MQMANGKEILIVYFKARLGHSILSNDQNSIFLFGGFGGLLKEKNDLWMFNVEENKWACIDKGFDFDHQRRTMIFGKKKSILLEKIQFDFVREEDQ